MSAEHVSWAYRHSAAKGPTFQVHQAIADSCNDQHDHEFWMRMASLAAKARVGRGTAQKAVGWLLENGYLELLSEDRQRSGYATRYRFLFPDVPVVFETRGSRSQREGVAPTSQGGSRSQRDGVAPTARPIKTQEETQAKEPKGEDARAEASDERVGWQVPDVVERSGFLEAALALCDHWASRLEDRGVRAKERARSKTWVAPMEALLRIDERDPVQVRRVVDWLEDGRDEVATFWQGNVLSPAKLREKWEQMGQQYRRQQTRRPESQHDRGRSALLDDIERNKP